MIPANNWHYLIECKDCKATFNVESVSLSVKRFDGGNRMAVLTIPNECPKCRNLKMLEGGKR